MKWVAIAGTWSNTNEQVEGDVRKEVSEIIKSGDGIVTGGALGVDFIATDEALRLTHSATQIKIFLPCTVDRYSKHYRKRAEERVISPEQAEGLIKQIETVLKASPVSVIENPTNKIIDKDAYFDRITNIVNAADRLVAFQVNGSAGTQDTINKAEKKGIEVRKYSYTI